MRGKGRDRWIRGRRLLTGAAVWAAALFAAAAAPSLATGTHGRPGVPRSHRGTGWHRRAEVRDVLHANEIGRVRFGKNAPRVIQGLDQILRHQPSEPFHAVSACGADHAVSWPGLVAFFHGARFIGYSYRPAYAAPAVPTLATARGLQVGDTLTMGKRLYGPSFHDSPADGGSWWAVTPQGRVQGVISGWPGGPRGSVATIAAGDVGCPGVKP